MREMKNSGVEWIGKIPKEWSIVKFKAIPHRKVGAILPEVI